jgi:hypothetical protein
MRFRPLADFSVREPGYQILPLRFMRWSPDEVFVTNDAGEFLFIGRDAFATFAEHRLPRTAPEYRALKARHLLVDGDPRLRSNCSRPRFAPNGIIFVVSRACTCSS